MLGLYSTSDPSSPLSVPIGARWTEPRPTPPLPTKKTQKPLPTPEEFMGDQVLARSIAFMRETMISREAMLASVEGDVGRLYEMIKVMLFTFAGSPHSNYTTYFLEMITKLEWESSPDLKSALLAVSLVNLTGREGSFSAGDTIQEYFNRILEAVVGRKGVEYGDNFIRNIWSRNLHHVARLKSTWLEGVGLAPRSKKHTKAKALAEMRILMQEYQATELHSFRAGRTFDVDLFVDDFELGLKKLGGGGKLKSWTSKTTRSRGLQTSSTSSQEPFVHPEDSDDEDGSEDDSGDIIENPASSFGVVHVSDGDLVFLPIDIEAEAVRIIKDMESMAGNETDDSSGSVDADSGMESA